MQTLEQAIKEAYEKGYINDINDPWADLGCYGNTDPETTTLYNCDECPLNAYCVEAFDESISGVYQ